MFTSWYGTTLKISPIVLDMKLASKMSFFFKIVWRPEWPILISFSLKKKQRKIDFRQKWKKYSKICHYTVKNFHVIKFIKKIWKSVMKKGCFFITFLAKVTLKFDKSNFRKWENSIFNGLRNVCVTWIYRCFVVFSPCYAEYHKRISGIYEVAK